MVILPEVDGGSALPWVASCSRCWIIISRMGLVRQLLKIPRFGIIEEYSLNLLRALRFLLCEVAIALKS